jgi:hypothetical protein
VCRRKYLLKYADEGTKHYLDRSVEHRARDR